MRAYLHEEADSKLADIVCSVYWNVHYRNALLFSIFVVNYVISRSKNSDRFEVRTLVHCLFAYRCLVNYSDLCIADPLSNQW